MKKKGFTLIELLTVIVILAILIILVLPNIMKFFIDSKENAFLIEVKEIYKTAKQKWISESLLITEERIYSKSNSEVCDNPLDLNGRSEIEYFIRINKAGNVVEYYVTDGTFGFKYVGNGLLEEDIKDVFRMDELSEEDLFTIGCNGLITGANTQPVVADLLMSHNNPLRDEEFLRTGKQKSKIEKITFTNSLEGHTINNVDCFDAGSYGRGKILSWIEDKNSNSLYEVTIASEEEIFPSSCSSLFANMKNLKKIIGLEYLNTDNCDDMMYMFYNNNNLTSLDVTHFKTNNVTNMSEMFRGLQSLTTLDVSSFDTSQVTDMNHMFTDCRNLTTLDVSNFNTSKVTNMFDMFGNLRTITTLDLRNFDTSNVTNMSYMFYYDNNLKSIKVSSFNTSNVTNMELMFYNTKIVNLDLRNFNTSNVITMGSMFDNNYSLKTVDLSSFDTSKVENFESMFGSCNRLTTIYVSDKFVTTSARKSNQMFHMCNKLKGGSGTAWNVNYIDMSYARIDGGSSNPGYFTRK